MRFSVLCLLFSTLFCSLAFSKTVSWSSGPGYQFGNTTYIVSSILPSIHGNKQYGPQHLFLQKHGAWCVNNMHDKAPWVEIKLGYPAKFQRLYVKNGYTINHKKWLNNRRAKKIKVTAAHGFSQIITLKDSAKEQQVNLKLPIVSTWLKVQVLDTYSGKKFPNLCLSRLIVDLEQHNYE